MKHEKENLKSEKQVLSDITELMKKEKYDKNQTIEQCE